MAATTLRRMLGLGPLDQSTRQAPRRATVVALVAIVGAALLVGRSGLSTPLRILAIIGVCVIVGAVLGATSLWSRPGSPDDEAPTNAASNSSDNE